MSITKKLPVVAKKKKIDIKKFIMLAKKVKRSFEQEEEYLKSKTAHDENHNSSRFLPNI